MCMWLCWHPYCRDDETRDNKENVDEEEEVEGEEEAEEEEEVAEEAEVEEEKPVTPPPVQWVLLVDWCLSSFSL